MKNSKPDSTNETGRRQQLPPAELENRLNPITNQLQKIVVEFEQIQNKNAEFADKLKEALKEAEDDDGEYSIISMSSGSAKYCEEQYLTLGQVVKNLHREFIRSRYSDELKANVFTFAPNKLSDNEIRALKGFKNVIVDGEKVEPKKELEVGKWYKSKRDISTARFTKQGFCNSSYLLVGWSDNIGMGSPEIWDEITPQEIEEVLTRRCKELGLFDGEFECLSGIGYSNTNKKETQYRLETDDFYIGDNLAYLIGKFATLKPKGSAKFDHLTEWLQLPTTNPTDYNDPDVLGYEDVREFAKWLENKLSK